MPKSGPGPTGVYEAWKLVPRTIPRMEGHVERFAAIDRTQGVIKFGAMEAMCMRALEAVLIGILSETHSFVAYI